MTQKTWMNNSPQEVRTFSSTTPPGLEDARLQLLTQLEDEFQERTMLAVWFPMLAVHRLDRQKGHAVLALPMEQSELDEVMRGDWHSRFDRATKACGWESWAMLGREWTR